jgi:hypothetical protein
LAVVSEDATFSEQVLDDTDNALARIQAKAEAAIAIANAIEALAAFGPRAVARGLLARGATINNNTLTVLAQHLGDLLGNIDGDRERIDNLLRAPGESKEAAHG